jgi:hypothetical protein
MECSGIGGTAANALLCKRVSRNDTLARPIIDGMRASALLFICLSCHAQNPSFEQVGPLINQDGSRLVGSAQETVYLHNNPGAHDPSFDEVLTFLGRDETHEYRYTPKKFMCTEFAVMLHDHAEQAGLRCALVSIQFTQGEGHALDAFKTTDCGVVYVDCTGTLSKEPQLLDVYNTIAYVEPGKSYGRLPLSVGGIDPNHYSHYEKVMRLWDCEEERSRDLEEERKGLDERNRALEQEKGQFAQFNGRPASPEQADQIQSVIRDYNARVTALKKAQEAFNAKVASINKIQLALRCKYEMNPAPVKTIEAWCPK